LQQNTHDRASYDEYILGSAEVVGLMCLRVFTNNNNNLYNELKPSAMRLGAAFQKVNFLRDLKDDYKTLGRMYFPGINMERFEDYTKKQIEQEIESDFNAALIGIKKLPKESIFGVYVAYVYYRRIFQKIQSLPSKAILMQRIRIPNYQKISLLFSSYCRHSINMMV
jgi:15-cis-phytoene synthase